MGTPLFSIVVPAWNRSDLTCETIRSLLNQTLPQSLYEVIVVDDGSTDDTVERLKEFSDRIRVFRQANSGAAAARTLGIQHARGEYLVSFDSDDLLLPDALLVYKRVIEAFGRPPVVLAGLFWFRGDQTPGCPTRTVAQIRCVKCRDYLGKNILTPITNSVMVLQKSEVLRVGAYAKGSDGIDDIILLFKLGTASPMIKIVEPVTVAHRLHEKNLRRDLELISKGYLAHIQNERQGLYPGGWRRMLDRRGLIGSDVFAALFSLFINVPYASFRARFVRIPGLLLHARGMILAGFIRKACSYFYNSQSCLLDLSNPENWPPLC